YDSISQRGCKDTEQQADIVDVWSEVLTVGECEETRGPNDRGPVAPVLGQTSLTIPAKEEFLEDRYDGPAPDGAEEPELPPVPRHVEEGLSPGHRIAVLPECVPEEVDREKPRDGSCRRSGYDQRSPGMVRARQPVRRRTPPPMPPVDGDSEREPTRIL